MRNKIFIYFSTPRNIFWFPLSFLIRLIESPDRFTLWHSSHASIRVDDNVYEAVLFLGVRKIPYDKWITKNNIKRTYFVLAKDDSFLSFLEGSIGVPYAFLELLGILYSKLYFKLFKKEVDNPFAIINRKVKCTELVMEAINRITPIAYSQDIDNIGVRDLENYIARNNNVFAYLD
jgi:hypothetical protein